MTAAIKMHVKKGDTVLVLSGKDKGKEGKIIEALPKKAKVVVEGVNKVKRHTKPSQANPQGGIITKEAAIASSKVMLVCPACKKATRIKKTAVSGSFVRNRKEQNQENYHQCDSQQDQKHDPKNTQYFKKNRQHSKYSRRLQSPLAFRHSPVIRSISCSASS